MRQKSLVLILLFAVVFLTTGAFAVEPFGATPNEIGSSRASSGAAGNNSALAGNVTELDLSGFSNTQTWQGYFGNVTGAIQLADVADNVMYNWSLASPRGEVYASTANGLTWSSIACLDWDTQGVPLETAFNLDQTDLDGVNETFSAAKNHLEFYTANVQFAAGACMTAWIYDNTGASATNKFEEVLMTDSVNTIYTSLLENDAAGFDGESHDFQMMVLEDGHGTDIDTTPYYFWVELE